MRRLAGNNAPNAEAPPDPFGIWQGFFCPVLLGCPCAWSEPGTAAYNGLTALCRLAAHQYNGRH
nr:MAG TPA: hypothetical protein [Caudoviricetes sp.]